MISHLIDDLIIPFAQNNVCSQVQHKCNSITRTSCSLPYMFSYREVNKGSLYKIRYT